MTVVTWTRAAVQEVVRTVHSLRKGYFVQEKSAGFADRLDMRVQ